MVYNASGQRGSSITLCDITMDYCKLGKHGLTLPSITEICEVSVENRFPLLVMDIQSVHNTITAAHKHKAL